MAAHSCRPMFGLRPGAELVIEIVGPQVHAVPFRVLRSELARISEDGAIYRAHVNSSAR